MVSASDLEVFLARVRRHGGRLDQLAAQATSDVREALLTALTELEMMYEDLVVADEELRVQGEQLRASQLALAASHTRYQQLFDAAPVAYLITTLDGTIKEANLAASDLLGSPTDRGVGKPVQAFVDLRHRRAVRRLLLDVRRDGGLVTLDTLLLPRGAEPAFVGLTVGYFPDPVTAESGLQWVLTPTSPPESAAKPARQPAHADPIAGWPGQIRRSPDGHDPVDGWPAAAGSGARRPREVDRSHRLLDALVDDSPVGMLVLDRDLRLRRASRALTDGKPVAGAALADLLPEGAATVAAAAERCLREAAPVTDVAVRGRALADPAARRRWLVSCYPLLDTAGNADAVGCLFLDMPDEVDAVTAGGTEATVDGARVDGTRADGDVDGVTIDGAMTDGAMTDRAEIDGRR